MSHIYDLNLDGEMIDVDNLYAGSIDGAQILNAAAVNQNASGTGHDNAVNLGQMNNGVDSDVLENARIEYDAGDGGSAHGGSAGDAALGATGTAGPAVSSGNEARVNDDGSISNAGNATSSAAAASALGVQTIAMDGNTQANTAKISVDPLSSAGTGGSHHTPATYGSAVSVDADLIDAADLEVDDLTGLQFANADAVNQDASGPGNDTTINLDQINNLVSNDEVDGASVSYEGANGGPAHDASGADQTLSSYALAGTASSTSNVASVGDNGSISNAGNAVSSASASAEAFTQTISTGGNVQLNSADIAIDGGYSEGNQGPAGLDRDNVEVGSGLIDATSLDVDDLEGLQVLNADVVNQNATGSGNDNAVNIDQMNNGVDNDEVKGASVRYQGGNAGPATGAGGGDFTVTATATAAAATAAGNSATVGDDGTISNAGNATSSASASAEAFTQAISTGDNTQANQLKIAVEGGTVGAAPAGGHDHKDKDDDCDKGCGPKEPPVSECGPNVCDDQHHKASHEAEAIDVDGELIDADCLDVCDLDGIQFVNADVVNQDVSGSGNDNAFNIDQINNLVDNDGVYCPTVSFCGADGGDCYGSNAEGADFTLTATASSGPASSTGNDAFIGDDGSVSGAGNASSTATATADAFSQTIVMGANVQFNSATLDVTGADGDMSL